MARLQCNNWTSVCVVGVSLAAITGCVPSGPSLVQVSGTVTHDGQPLEHITVHFVPESGRPSWGNTDAQGRYTAEYSADRKGVVVGRHRVFVVFAPKDPQVKMDMEMGKYRPPTEIGEVVRKYGNVETSPLSFDIQETQAIDLNLD